MSKLLLMLYVATVVVRVCAKGGSARTLASAAAVYPTIEMIQLEGLACFALASSIAGLRTLKGNNFHC